MYTVHTPYNQRQWQNVTIDKISKAYLGVSGTFITTREISDPHCFRVFYSPAHCVPAMTPLMNLYSLPSLDQAMFCIAFNLAIVFPRWL